MIKHLSLILVLLLSFLKVEAAPLYEMPRTQIVPIKDNDLNRQYELYIKLPSDYDKNTNEKYPVIYTTDAVWHMDLLSGVTEYLMPNVILVGISWQTNMSDKHDLGHRKQFASRFRDYSFVEHDKPKVQAKYNFGQADEHISFIQKDVIKYVEKNYRVISEERTYLGYSMGGEFGAYILLSQPNTFKHYILGSPSLDPSSAKYLNALQTKNSLSKTDVNVFVSIGELETKQMELTQNFVSQLLDRKKSGIAAEELTVIKDSDHGTAVPETFTRSIKWLKKLQSKQLAMNKD